MSSTNYNTSSMAPMLLAAGAIFAGTSVMLGAFGAHGLKSLLSAQMLNTFEIGVRYQMYHGLAILVLPVLSTYAEVKWLNRAAMCFVVGGVLFSGSLYALALTGIKWFGPVTPLGGLFFIMGWAVLAFTLVRGQRAIKVSNDN
ncbi:DUF423 domain-containing protein [Alteromonas sp. 009811495]|uniref:DUF423 domain-containing protein n=1 Tax=Alteromonas sp. 009811495 TaxID=3002962 RepID=UPI00237EC8C1|nr:DUF423 domain-containing protein [Alteromonas sp. 009811495]WDT87589.1 DUF423 domain-containing protein [Alteromonas sp. 009811495]